MACFGPFWAVVGGFGKFPVYHSIDVVTFPAPLSHEDVARDLLLFPTCGKQDQKWENSKRAHLGPIGPTALRPPLLHPRWRAFDKPYIFRSVY